jgi:cytochrome c-type biogenesis protein CcmF
VVSSVHAFAESGIGVYFISFITVMGVASLALILSRLEYLKSENELDSIVSRESSFLFNNLVFLGACFAVLWGTVFPVISEALQDHKITVGAPFYNRIYVPLGLFLLFLTGVAPLLAWRKTSLKSLRKNFLWPFAASVAAAAVFFGLGIRAIWPVISFSLCLFVSLTILIEFHRGVRARMRAHGEAVVLGFYRLVARNKRRYGGYIVHFGIVLIFVGISGSAFNKETQGEVTAGDTLSIGSYTLHCEKIEEKDRTNYYFLEASLAVSKNGNPITVLSPEKRVYKASEQSTSEVSMRSTLKEDLYAVFAGMTEDGDRAVIQVYLNPLVSWLWIGGIVLALGTIVCILPDARQTRMIRRKKDLDRLLAHSERV